MRVSELTPEELEGRRAYDRNRKAKKRAEEKQERLEQMKEESAQDDEHYCHRVYGWPIRLSKELYFYGEEVAEKDRPDCRATTHAAELAIHREFLRALGRPDVQPVEALRQVSKRCYEAWLTDRGEEFDGNYTGQRQLLVYAFNRIKQQFDGFHGYSVVDKPFEECWIPPKHCSPGPDDPIDLSTLPELPTLPASVVIPTPKPVVTGPSEDEPAERELQRILNEKKRQLEEDFDRQHMLSLPPGAFDYLRGYRR